MKVRSSIRKICPSCKLVRRGRKQFVICPANARHKQRQGLHTLAGAAAAPELGGAAAGALLLPLAPGSLAGAAAAPRPSAAAALAALRAFPTGAGEDDDL